MRVDDARALFREFAASGEFWRGAEKSFDLIISASELQNLADYKTYLRTLLDAKPQ